MYYLASIITPMEKLATKTQYVHFEPGEFTDQKLRSYGEVIALIEAFPWEKQREHIQIGLTNPGVLIETTAPTWLKLAVYYNGKFVLYFFDGSSLYSKSLMVPSEAYPFIAAYFDKGTVEPAAFKKENLLFKHVAEHFITNDFEYRVTKKRIIEFLRHSSLINFFYLIAFFPLAVFAMFRHNFIVAIICLVMALLFGGLVNLLLLLNYYRYMKPKILIMSKGNESFWYGNFYNPRRYEKNKIEHIDIVSSYISNSKGNFWAEFAIYKIYFSNNDKPIAFTSLLIDKGDFTSKLNKAIQKEVYETFPFFNDATM